MNQKETLFSSLKNELIVSCQPVAGGPLDSTAMVAAMGLAAEHGGAAGLRIESIASVNRVSKVTGLPIIGIVKRDVSGSPVRITPTLEDVEALVAAGAKIVAYDATQRVRPVPTMELAARIRELGAMAMADCACIADGTQALAEGAHILGTTLSGYAYGEGPEHAPPDLDLVQEFAAMNNSFVIAEGRFRTPDEAAEAIRNGADSVVVGSAITRIEHITSWFSGAIAEASETR